AVRYSPALPSRTPVTAQVSSDQAMLAFSPRSTASAPSPVSASPLSRAVRYKSQAEATYSTSRSPGLSTLTAVSTAWYWSYGNAPAGQVPPSAPATVPAGPPPRAANASRDSACLARTLRSTAPEINVPAALRSCPAGPQTTSATRAVT